MKSILQGLQFLAFALFAQVVAADFIVTRAFQDTNDNQFERLFLSEVTRDGGSVTVGGPTMLNPPLADAVQIWGMQAVSSQGQVVYGAFDPGDSSFDDLFVASLRQPGVARQLNPPLGETDIPVFFAGNGSSSRIVYAVNNFATDIESLFLADSRVPGRSTLVASLPVGDTLGSAFAVSPDGGTFAYAINPASGPMQLGVTFLNRPPNSTVVFSDATLTDYRPTEIAFSDDGSLLVWIDDGDSDEPGPLRAVTLDPDNGTISPVIQVNAGDFITERVSEFAIKPGSNTLVVYRGFDAGSTLPSDTLLRDLATMGPVIKLNTGPAPGSVFTTFEDVIWRGDSVLYNAAEDQLLRADVLSVAQDSPGTGTVLTRQVPFSAQRTNSAAGASHMVLSPDQDNTAILDGNPTRNVFVIDRFNIGASFQPFEITPDRILGDLTDPDNTPPQFNPASDMIALTIFEDRAPLVAHLNLFVAAATSSASDMPVLNTANPQVFDFNWFDASAVPDSAPTALAAAVLPASRSGEVGSALTAFVTLINGGAVNAESCSLDLITNVPARLSYQTTDSATNELTGVANEPVDIAPGAAQSFVITISLNGEFAPTDAELAYSCRNADTVTPLSGLNTLLLSASTTPVPDVIALAATATGDGIARLDSSGNGAFSVASINVGTASTISVTADSATNAAVALCESDPLTGVCVNPAAPTFGAVSVSVPMNGTPTFSVFASSSDSIASDAANNRIRVLFRDAADNIRGQTSVAVQSGP